MVMLNMNVGATLTASKNKKIDLSDDDSSPRDYDPLAFNKNLQNTYKKISLNDFDKKIRTEMGLTNDLNEIEAFLESKRKEEKLENKIAKKKLLQKIPNNNERKKSEKIINNDAEIRALKIRLAELQAGNKKDKEQEKSKNHRIHISKEPQQIQMRYDPETYQHRPTVKVIDINHHKSSMIRDP